MAKQITMFEANDGTRFDSLERAETHDLVETTVATIMAVLPDPPAGDFGNDRRGYWQQNPTMVLKVRVALIELALELKVCNGWFNEHIEETGHKPEDFHPLGIAGRIMSEGAPRPLDLAWHRLCRIDDRGREWEQPFFAINSEKGCQYPYGQEPAS